MEIGSTFSLEEKTYILKWGLSFSRYSLVTGFCAKHFIWSILFHCHKKPLGGPNIAIMPILCLRKKKKKKRILEVKNLPILANSKTGIWTHGRQAAKHMYWRRRRLWKIATYSSPLDSGWTSRKTFSSHIIPFWLLWFWWAYLMKRWVTPHKDLAERVPLTIIWVILFHLFGQATCSRVLKIMFFLCLYCFAMWLAVSPIKRWSLFLCPFTLDWPWGLLWLRRM